MEKTDFVAWLKAHKKQLIIAGISATAVIAIVLGVKNKDALKELLIMLESKCKKASVPQKTSAEVVEIIAPAAEVTTRQYIPCNTCFDVNSHIRLLPEGKHHSAEKAAEAIASGIELLPNQTIVDGYVKGLAA